LPFDAKQFTALFAGVNDAVYVEDLDSHRILYWNAAAAVLFGYAPTDALPQESAKIYAEEFGFLRAGTAQRGELENDRRWRGAQRFRRADGTSFDAEAAASLLSSESGGCAVVVVQPRKPSEESAGKFATPELHGAVRVNASEAKNGEQSIGQLLRNLPSYAVFTTDTSGVVREWNQEASRLFGYEGAEVFGKPIAVICAGDAERALQKTFQEARERGTSRYYQWIVRKDGRRLYARVATFALWNSAEVQGFLFLLRDDSREPDLRQILREKEQMAAIGTAASILAHEIGNPLNGISTTVQLLEHCLGRPTPPNAASMLSSVQDLKSEVKRLTALLSGFKNIAWPQKIAVGPVDLKRLIQPLLGQIEKRSSRQNVELSFDCQQGLPLLSGDDDKLKQALLHVLENALDAMPHGGKLDIKVYRHEQTVCVDIVDTGVGIPKNLKVFDLFSSTKPDSIGLGLFMVQQIVLAHDGAITYSSTPGQGTTFHVTFALNAAPEPAGGDFIDAI
jgi:two-component system, NtrC family, sensor histidine kinase HydH